MEGPCRNSLFSSSGAWLVSIDAFEWRSMAASATLPRADKRLIDLYLLGVDAGRGVLGVSQGICFVLCLC
jgi:hypothetical protein